MADIKFGVKLEPKFHESFKASFKGLNAENFNKGILRERFKGVELRKNAKGELVFDGKQGEVKVDEEFMKRNNGDVLASLREAMSAEKWNKLNETLSGQNEGTFLTDEQMAAAQNISSSPEVQAQLDEQVKKRGSTGFKDWMTEQLKKIAEKGGQYAFLAGMTAATLAALGANRQGCYLYNMGTGALISKVSSDTDGTKCVCGGKCDNLPYPDPQNPSKSCLKNPVATYTSDTIHMADCDMWCREVGNDPTPLQDWSQCGKTCSCMTKRTGYEAQTGVHQIGFKVVKGDVVSTASWLFSSVGLAINGVVDDVMNVVDTVANKVLDFFKQWWVIAILVIVALVIILVPVLVTQLPKAKAKQAGLTAGRMYLYG